MLYLSVRNWFAINICRLVLEQLGNRIARIIDMNNGSVRLRHVDPNHYLIPSIPICTWNSSSFTNNDPVPNLTSKIVYRCSERLSDNVFHKLVICWLGYTLLYACNLPMCRIVIQALLILFHPCCGYFPPNNSLFWYTNSTSFHKRLDRPVEDDYVSE